MLYDDLIELSEYFQILYDIRVLIRYQDKEQLLDWHVYVSDHVCLNMSTLFSRFNKLWKIRHVLLEFETIDCHELSCKEYFAGFRAN